MLYKLRGIKRAAYLEVLLGKNHVSVFFIKNFHINWKAYVTF